MDYPNLVFPNEDQLRESAEAKFELSEWILERDNYILKNNRLPFPWSDEGRFIMHCSQLQAPGNPKIKFQVIVSCVI